MSLPAVAHKWEPRIAARYKKTFDALQAKCPAWCLKIGGWRACVRDGGRFLAQWGERAQGMNWSSADLFGLVEVPAEVEPLQTSARITHLETGSVAIVSRCDVVGDVAELSVVGSVKGHCPTRPSIRKASEALASDLFHRQPPSIAGFWTNMHFLDKQNTTSPFPGYRCRERDPVSDQGPILKHRSGPSSQSGSHCRIPGVCRRRAKTPTPIRPFHRRGLPVCTGPNFEKEKKKSDFSNFSGSRFFCLDTSRTEQRAPMMRCEAIHKF
jgi:hypothetical protein